MNPFQWGGGYTVYQKRDSHNFVIIIIIIIINNKCHSNIIVDRLQGCSHSKKLRENESESRSSKVVWQAQCQL